MSARGVLVRGHGLAALAAAAVLSRQGMAFAMTTGAAPCRLVTLNRPTQDLIGDVFGAGVVEGLGACGSRRVDWLPGVDTDGNVDPDARVVELDVLLARLRRSIGPVSSSLEHVLSTLVAAGRNTNGRLVAAPPLATGVWEHLTLGAQKRVSLEGGQRIFAGDDGWIFLAPRPDGSCFVQATVLPGDESSAISMVARALNRSPAAVPSADQWIDTAPALGSAVGSAGELRAGESAVIYDPLCGDGCGNAIRSGVLAAAVATRAIIHPSEETALREWYRARQHQNFLAHMQACMAAYARARFAIRWKSYRAALVDITARLAHIASPDGATYWLVDGQLVPRTAR